MNKRRLSQASLLRLPICFFQGREKAKWFRLPICFFPAREKAKLFQISNLLFPNPGKSNRKSEEQLFLQRGQVTNMTCADLSQDLREPFATAVRAHSKSAFEIRSLTRKRWVFERRSYDALCCCSCCCGKETFCHVGLCFLAFSFGLACVLFVLAICLRLWPLR